MAGARTVGGLPKWQLAILFGAPLAIGLGYLYLRNRQKEAAAAQEKPPPGADHASNTVSLDEGKERDRDLDRANRHKAQGNHAFREGKFDEAARCYERAMEACPPDRTEELATYYQNRSACHEKLQDWQAVKKDCTAALALNGKYVKAFLRRSRAAERSGDLQMALEDVTAACILEKFQVQSTLQLADRLLTAHAKIRAKETAGTRRPTMPSKHLVATYLGSFAADPVCGAPDPLRPEDSASPYGKARKALRNADYESIVPACAEEIAKGGKDAADARLLRGTFLLLLGRNDEALADLSAIADDPNAPGTRRANALVKRALLKTQTEKPGADEDFALALSLKPEEPDAHHQRGQTLLMAGEADAAAEHFEKACRLAPEFAAAHTQLAYAKYLAARMRGAPPSPSDAEPFERIVERFPRAPEALVVAAEILSETSEFDRADALLRKAFDADPKNANVLVHRALLKLKSAGDVDEAVRLMEEAISIDDKCLFAYETLGTIEVQRQNLKKAVSLFERAIDLAKTESDMQHLFALKDAARSQLKVSERYGLNVGSIPTA